MADVAPGGHCELRSDDDGDGDDDDRGVVRAEERNVADDGAGKYADAEDRATDDDDDDDDAKKDASCPGDIPRGIPPPPPRTERPWKNDCVPRRPWGSCSGRRFGRAWKAQPGGLRGILAWRLSWGGQCWLRSPRLRSFWE